jgi:hypothetical protein
LVTLQYALPFAPYSYLNVSWPELSVLLALTKRGACVSKFDSDTSSEEACRGWSHRWLDGLTLYIADHQMQMRPYRETIHSVVLGSEIYAQELSSFVGQMSNLTMCKMICGSSARVADYIARPTISCCGETSNPRARRVSIRDRQRKS